MCFTNFLLQTYMHIDIRSTASCLDGVSNKFITEDFLGKILKFTFKKIFAKRFAMQDLYSFISLFS